MDRHTVARLEGQFKQICTRLDTLLDDLEDENQKLKQKNLTAKEMSYIVSRRLTIAYLKPMREGLDKIGHEIKTMKKLSESEGDEE